MQDRKGVREAWSERWRQGEWAGTVDGTESPTSELPRKVDLEGRSKSRSLQQRVMVLTAWKTLATVVKQGAARAVVMTSGQGSKHGPTGNRPCPPGS